MRGGIRALGPRGSVAVLAGFLFAGGFGGLAGALLLYLRRLGPAAAENSTATLLTFLVLSWALGPVLALASDNTLDMDSLALFPLRAAQLMPGLLLAAPVGFGGLFTVLLLVGLLAGSAPLGAGAVLSLVAVLATLALCLTTSRLVSTALSALRGRRTWRDMALFAVPLVALAVNAGIQLANRAFVSRVEPGAHVAVWGRGVAVATASVLRWLPPGWPAQALAAARAGDLLRSLAASAATVALTATLVWWWWLAIQKANTTAMVASGTGHRHRQLVPGWLRVFPAQVQAVAAKELRYAWRDPRVRATMLGSSAAAFAPLLSFQALHTGSARLPLLAGWPALAFGAAGTNLFGFDAASWWTNVAAGTRLRAEVFARTMARMTVGLVVILPVLGLLVWLSHNWIGLLPAAGLAAAAGGVSIGLGARASVKTPFPYPPAGRSGVFSGAGAGQGAAAAGAALGTMFGSALIASPVLILSLVLPARSPAQALALLLGLAIGVAGWIVGVRLAATLGQGREVDLLAVLSTAR